MSKRTTFTNVTPLPAGISRAAALGFLRDHEAMIDLNPLVIERHRLDAPPPHAPEDEREAAGCTWWSMTDTITYLPGIKGELTYSAAFLDLRDGLQTHVYAPMGTDIRNRWTLGGTLPGEPPEPVELGLGAPRQGLYIREDVELRCNFLMASFVRKTLSKAHTKVIENIAERAQAQTGSQGAGGEDDGTYGQGHDSQAATQRQRRLNAAANLAPVSVYSHRAAASETDLSPTTMTPEPLSPLSPFTPARGSGQYFHTHQDSWTSSQGWGLQPPNHPAQGLRDRTQEQQQQRRPSLMALELDDDSPSVQQPRSQSLSQPHIAELQ
ncbi:hypothetical protein PG993_003275 [Apiospora rasikravindrae]|uniref:DUF7053 domain-containing protein n=1 Tax=Apiospora rasikravindrae TaxID=990691 RepID=A0ABR1U1D1_9PEZI